MVKTAANKFEDNKKTLKEVLFDLFALFTESERYYSAIGTVKAVNLSDATAAVEISNGAVVPDVRLQQTKNTLGFVAQPVIGSLVIISFTDNVTAYISMYSEIETVLYQDGINGGLIKIETLTSKINALKNEMQVELGLIATGIAGAGGAYTPGTLSPLSAGDYENIKFKH